MSPGAVRIVLDVSCDTRIKHRSLLSWQVQHMVMLDWSMKRPVQRAEQP